MLANKKTNQGQAGFTLIEVAIYLALFGLLFVGVIAGAYSIMETSGRNQTQATIQEEGNFLSAKIGNLVSNAKDANISADLRALTIVSWSEGNATSTIGLDAAGENLVISRSGSETVPLNNSTVKVRNFGFAKLAVPGNKGGIKCVFELAGNTPAGAVVSVPFEIESYLRQ